MPEPNNPNATWTVLSMLTWATSYFEGRGIDSPRSTAELLLAHAIRRSRLDLYLNFDQPLIPEELAAFKVLVKRRIAREPVAYILGTREFFSLAFKVNPAVLIPRPETECLVEQVLNLMDEGPSSKSWKVLDVGTGSGAIVVSLATQRPQHHYFASDISLEALGVAKANAAGLGVKDRIHFFAGTFLETVAGPLDLIISNPPYIRHKDMATLEPEISRHEPSLALDGGADGLGAYRRLIEQAPTVLAPDGRLIVEIGSDQKKGFKSLVVADQRYGDPVFTEDYGGRDRIAQLALAAPL